MARRLGSAHLAALLLMVSPYAAGPAGAVSVDAAAAPLDRLLAQVHQALAVVGQQAGRVDLPPPDSVELTLKTSLGREGDSGFRYLVVTQGAELERARVQTMRITLGLPDPAQGTPTATQSDDGASAVPGEGGPLATAILAAATGLHAARSDALSMKVDQLRARLDFVVRAKADAPGFELVPITLDAGATVPGETQTLAITFRRPRG